MTRVILSVAATTQDKLGVSGTRRKGGTDTATTRLGCLVPLLKLTLLLQKRKFLALRLGEASGLLFNARREITNVGGHRLLGPSARRCLKLGTRLRDLRLKLDILFCERPSVLVLGHAARGFDLTP